MAKFFTQWEEWGGGSKEPFRGGRFPLMRLIRFKTSGPLLKERGETSKQSEEHEGLSLNLSDRGLCLVTAWSPTIGDVLHLHVPTPVPIAGTPTLAEVRWVRPLPAGIHGGFVVGLKFLL